MARYNPLSFTPRPVIFFVTATYIALFASLLVVHFSVPSYPSKPPTGINLTEAWNDLAHITRQFHPYNSRANDHVRSYLRARIDHIIASKNISEHQVLVLDDNIANVTFSAKSTSVYFEGTNIIVAIRGTEDAESWNTHQISAPEPSERTTNNGAVLVNAHYDSVSSGYGATDDGVGVVTVVQLLSYLTETQNWPKRTVILLLNNGEEDYLNGAKAFMRNGISRIVRTFVNLEGAGAGGRATLFRSTDSEVTRFYKSASHPFGTVVSGDGFKLGMIRSETDYSVFHGELGLRGLDIAFMEPRARYHTVEDSTRETSLNSVWHMLSAAVATTSGLASVVDDRFGGPARQPSNGNVDAGTGTSGVWFDIFGKVFIVFRLHTMFALCVTLLVVAPLTLIGLAFGLSAAGKNYMFARKTYLHSSDDDNPVELYGWRGFFRFPIIVAIATAVVIGLAFLVVRVNPHIVYSSPYAVWSMMLSAWFSLSWFFSRGADAMRPSALQRLYALIWLFIGSFAILTLVTVFVNNYEIAAGYAVLFYFAAIFLAALISFIELFFAPSKSAYVQYCAQVDDSRQDSDSFNRPLTGTTSGRSEDRHAQDDEATETTSLLRGDRRSFARYGNRRESVSEGNDDREPEARKFDLGNVYPGEQDWSGKLPSWLWILQFLVLAPLTVILVGQIALLLTSALYQTPADGSSSLLIYIAFAALTMFLLAPTGPFIHRFTYHIPTFLFLVCIATVIYNLVAFPFSRDNRLKVKFRQQVECDTGTNTVTLTGVDDYLQRVIGELPSAQGKYVNCTPHGTLMDCRWEGIAPEVVARSSSASQADYTKSWLEYSIDKINSTGKARFHIKGQDTRACRILFDMPILDLAVVGAVSDSRFRTVGETGSRKVQLWHREWSQPWDVDVSWDASKRANLSGSVVCLWSDANSGQIPAFDELQHYMPAWAIMSKQSDGLVEGYKHFVI